MAEDNCSVCTSNEGIFLDVVEKPEICDKARNCKLDKVLQGLTKLCHKCIFEIEKCNSFVEKIKVAANFEIPKRACCVLCLDLFNEDIFFDLSNQKVGINELIHKIQDVFSEELKINQFKKQLICLNCRYCVDLLADLRELSDQAPDKLKNIIKYGIDATDLPKTRTSVVKRSTTFNKSPKLDLTTPSDTDSEFSSMSSKRKLSKTNKSPASKSFSKSKSKSQRKCDECKKGLDNSMDLYRIYHSGKTVCKQCWLTIDPGKVPSKKRKKVNYVATKLCSVLLKDEYLIDSKNEEDNTKNVLTDDSDWESTNKSKSKKIKLETGIEKNEINESEEEPEIKITKAKRGKENIETKSKKTSRKRKDSDESIQSEFEVKPTRSLRKRKESEESIQSEFEAKPTRSLRKRKESEEEYIPEEVEVRPKRLTRGRKESEQSIQEEEIKPTRNSRNRKDSGQSSQDSVKNNRSTRGRKDSEQSLQEEVEINVDVDSDYAPNSKKSKTSRADTKSMPKQRKSKATNQSNSPKAKGRRGRSSSKESTSSVRRSNRNIISGPEKLDDIIEIDDSDSALSNAGKLSSEKEKVEHKGKRSRRNKLASDNEHSDADSNISSKELTPVSKTKLEEEESPNAKSVNDATQEMDIDKTKSPKHSTPKTTQSNDIETEPIEIENSESEEIDILKSTDEETKEDHSETKINDQRTSKSPTIEQNTTETQENDESKSEKEIETSTEKEVLRDDSQNQNNIQENESSSNEKSPKSKRSIKSESKECSELDILNEENVNEQNKSLDAHDVDTEENLNEDVEDDVSESVKENKTSRRKQPSNSPKSRKSKASKKQFKKGGNKNNEDDVVTDTSDSELKKIKEVQTNYTCSICDKIFDNRLVGLQHELTHMKTLEIKLEKIEIPKTVKNTSESETKVEDHTKESDSQLNKEEDKMLTDEQQEEKEESTKEKETSDNESENYETANEKEVTNNGNEQKTIESSNENEDIVLSETEKETHNGENEIDENSDKNNEAQDDTNEDENVEEVESVLNEDRSKSASPVHATSRRTRHSKKIEENSDIKSRSRKTTENSEVEKEVSTVTDSDSDKIAEAVQETLNDMAELHGRLQESSSAEESIVPTENEDEHKTEESTNSNESTAKNTGNIEEDNSDVVEAENNENDIPKSNDEVLESESNEEVECNKSTPAVDTEEDSAKEVTDTENEASKRAEESEIEITEIDDMETEAIDSENNVETVDISENEECEVTKTDDDVEIEEVGSSKDVNEDENSADSVTVVHASSENVSKERSSEDSNKDKQNEAVEINDDDGNNTEEEEALAQESLEDLLQRKGLQIIDEFAESVTDGDEESEKDINISSDKDNCQKKDIGNDSELEIKISDSECTEILEISSKSTNKQKENDTGVVGESQIIQDVDVVEEVINDDDQPQSDVVQEVEVESNGNCLEVTNNVVGEVLTEVFNATNTQLEKRLELQTEPISDDETYLVSESLQNISTGVRRNQDMPSLDPICEDIDDE